MKRYPPARVALLLAGCVVLGTGVGFLLTADLGSDGYSTLVSGVTRATGLSFGVCNIAVSAAFLIIAAARRVLPDLGTVVQIALVGWTVAAWLALLERPASAGAQVLLGLTALPILALGIALYLGSRLGAGPAEAAAQAWDPPLPFRWSYSALQAGCALGGWALGAAVGPGTLAVIIALGPMVDLSARMLGLRIAGPRAGEGVEPATEIGGGLARG